MALTLASEKSVEYFKTLFEERFGEELPAERYEGMTQSQISGAIKRLLEEEGVVPASVEQQNEVLELAAKVGIKITVGETLAAVNRQLRSLRRQVNAQEYRASVADFDAFLEQLRPSKPAEAPIAASAPVTDDIPF